MFDRQEFRRLRPLIVFFLCFTLGFCLFAATLRYTFPFLAGFLLALFTQPIVAFFCARLHCRPALAAALSTLAAYVFLLGILILLGIWLVYEISHLIDYLSNLDISRLTAPINALIGRVGEYLSRMDENFIRENQQQIISLARSGAGLMTTVLTAVLSFLTSLPAIFTMFLVMVLSTYFFAKDMDAIKQKLARFFSNTAVGHIRVASRHGATLGGRYAVSYLLIYFLTFLETLLVFSVLDIPYPLVLSIVTGIADILPVLGPGAVYLPLALVSLCAGRWFKAGALLLCWMLITAIRQVVEPKIVSSSIHVHPLAMLASIYCALAANSFALLVYFSALLLIYQVLTQVGILPTLFGGPAANPVSSVKRPRNKEESPNGKNRPEK